MFKEVLSLLFIAVATAQVNEFSWILWKIVQVVFNIQDICTRQGLAWDHRLPIPIHHRYMHLSHPNQQELVYLSLQFHNTQGTHNVISHKVWVTQIFKIEEVQQATTSKLQV